MTEIGFSIQRDFRWDPFKADNFDNGYLLSARLQDPANRDKQISLAQHGRASEAISSVKEILAQGPQDLFILRELGLAQMAQGEYNNAAESFKTVLQRAPHCYVDLLHLARSLALDGKAAEGIPYLREYQNQRPAEKLSPILANIDQKTAPHAEPETLEQSTEPARNRPKRKAQEKPAVKREPKAKAKREPTVKIKRARDIKVHPDPEPTPGPEVQPAPKAEPTAPGTVNDTKAIPASEF